MAIEYRFHDANTYEHHVQLWPVVLSELRRSGVNRVFELGCGSGVTADMLCREGFEVTGVDSSESGIAIARKTYPHVRVFLGDAYHDLAADYGTFPAVVSLEVIEHLTDPRRFLRTIFGLLEPGGLGIVSTPYHGYLKNLALAVSGKMDSHFTVLWDGGHIKFFSMRTLGRLVSEAGFSEIGFRRVGRIPPLATSMVAIFRKPRDEQTARSP